ncbi:hypothetical protein CDD82_7899 [Ophiocordyceps australis]|uniref:Uncharacterized protein n=1 Tax=Ophiocordyceps australis TaxID=1399860 RepID=A0A2C5XE81_9HYPO|nr:hypothetical protein CDD82_7899 [Ophiocordyceps australis]
MATADQLPSSKTCFPNLPRGLQIQAHALKGRALHATRGFLANEPLHAFDATVLVPTQSRLSLVCAYCLASSRPLHACTACRAAYYCDKTCQAAGWQSGHSLECKALRAPRADLLPTAVRALVLLLLRERRQPCSAVQQLEGHVGARRSDETRWRDLSLMAAAACSFAAVDTHHAGLQHAVELLCKIETNALDCYDADLGGSVGLFLHPILAMANHSCLPNAMVHFIGRRAVLVAQRPIAAGQEIEISYTDYTQPLSKRNEALVPYCFQCCCGRCRDDLNVYQVCADFALPAPSGRSLHVDSAHARSLGALVQHGAFQRVARDCGETATRVADSRTMVHGLKERRQALTALYHDCKELVVAGLWAVSPLPQVLSDMVMWFTDHGHYASALAVACLIATACDAYRFTAYFDPVRVRNMLVIAKLLANTAQTTAELANTATVVARQADAEQTVLHKLRDIDQVSLCQMLLTMALESAPAGDAAGWRPTAEARQMLGEIKQLPGRQREMSFILAWAQSPANDECKAFFDYAVIKQVHTLASLGPDVLKTTFVRTKGKDEDSS